MTPRTFLNHDEIWNLVLAHSSCNQEKSARLPSRWYLNKLHERNEYYIASNHPIKTHLVSILGRSPDERRGFLEDKYREAEKVLVHVWEGIYGFSSWFLRNKCDQATPLLAWMTTTIEEGHFIAAWVTDPTSRIPPISEWLLQCSASSRLERFARSWPLQGQTHCTMRRHPTRQQKRFGV